MPRSSDTLLFPCEADGPPMLDFMQAFVEDAAAHERLLEDLGHVLDVTVAQNDQRCQRQATRQPDARSMFEGNQRCPLVPSKYFQRILKYTCASPCNLLIGLIYLQRLKDKTDGQLKLTSFNTQRLLLTASMLASKVHDDYFASNRQWALVGDLSLKELNQLELDMLWQLEFSLTVSREEFDLRVDELKEMTATTETENPPAACSTSAGLIADSDHSLMRAGSDDHMSVSSASDLSQCGTVDGLGDLLELITV
jgi:hypothetical protein